MKVYIKIQLCLGCDINFKSGEDPVLKVCPDSADDLSVERVVETGRTLSPENPGILEPMSRPKLCLRMTEKNNCRLCC